jgi:LmbE family N-acetylglucosaminyl deacetylase
MTEIVFAIPIAQEREEADRQTREELGGPRREEYEAALKEAGVTRQAVWHQQMPGGGALAIVYVEGSDPEAHQRFVTSDAAVSQWFVQRMQAVHGRDVSQPPLPVEKILDVRV